MGFIKGCRPWNAGTKNPRTAKCAVAGCEKRVHYLNRQLCTAHDQRRRKYGDPNAPRLRRAKTLEPWRSDQGYMQQWDSKTKKRKQTHRVVWERAYGPIPPGFDIHHRNGVRDDNRLENLAMVPRHLHPKNRYVMVGSLVRCPHCENRFPLEP